MRSSRPIYLNLLKIRQPLPAVVSILHRISGALLFLMLPLCLYVFEQSLSGEEAFQSLRSSSVARTILFSALALYAYHFLAGLRFLLFDLHRPGLFPHVKSSARVVLVSALLAILLLGAWLW